MDCAERMGISVDKGKGKVSHNGHETKVLAIPIGIDYEKFKNDPNGMRDVASRLAKRANVKILLGVDRLDYTKGILKKLLALEKFFEKYPGFKGKVMLLQIATPSRMRVEEYRMMKREIDEQVGRINGRLQTIDWTPIRYFYRTIPQERLLAYYKAADVALITPLMDGLNLVAKEYIAACDDGVLILSEFAGASEELREAIIVNPYDIEAMADRIKESLEISHSEKTTRLRTLKERVKRKDVYWWFNNFLREWKRVY
jgi:trehalose 6-phosphate synthase